MNEYQKLIDEFEKAGLAPVLSYAATDVLKIYKAFVDRSDVDRGSEAALTLATIMMWKTK